MHEAHAFPTCPICDAPSALIVAFRGGGGVTARCRMCGANAYALAPSGGRQESPSGYGRNPSYDGPFDIVKAGSTWLCDNAWDSTGPVAPPKGCRVVIRRNDMRLCETYWHEVKANICIPCSLDPALGFWLPARAG